MLSEIYLPPLLGKQLTYHQAVQHSDPAQKRRSDLDSTLKTCEQQAQERI